MKLNSIYNRLSNDQKPNYWSAVTNVVLVIFTFWMGLAVQQMIVDKNSEYTSKLVQYEYLDKVYSRYAEIIQKCNRPMAFLTVRLNAQPLDIANDILEDLQFHKTEWDNYVEAVEELGPIVIKYAETKQERDSIANYFTEIFTFTLLYKICSDSIQYSKTDIDNVVYLAFASPNYVLSTNHHQTNIENISNTVYTMYNETSKEQLAAVALQRTFEPYLHITACLERQVSYAYPDKNKSKTFLEKIQWMSLSDVVLLLLSCIGIGLFICYFLLWILPIPQKTK